MSPGPVPDTTRACVALGSNLDDPRSQVRRALAELDGLPATRVVRASSLYLTAPLGPAGQPDYINAVAVLQTGLEPEALLDGLQAIEAAHGRRRGADRWGPRTLDLDILLFGARHLSTPRLQIPHPHLHERAFVLQPLAEVAADLDVPGRGRAGDLAARCGDRGVQRLADV
jgi:2-amino-4-hydroxy-6-hydroxymethyldihydropteridine diphosphokinase